MDEIFGIDNFRNEIQVKRIRKSIQEFDTVKRLNVATDMILFYARTPEHRIRLLMPQVCVLEWIIHCSERNRLPDGIGCGQRSGLTKQ